MILLFMAYKITSLEILDKLDLILTLKHLCLELRAGSLEPVTGEKVTNRFELYFWIEYLGLTTLGRKGSTHLWPSDFKTNILMWRIYHGRL